MAILMMICALFLGEMSTQPQAPTANPNPTKENPIQDTGDEEGSQNDTLEEDTEAAEPIEFPEELEEDEDQ